MRMPLATHSGRAGNSWAKPCKGVIAGDAPRYGGSSSPERTGFPATKTVFTPSRGVRALDFF